ncbi:MAG: hypothetical protein J7502_07730 [Flavisolibacter sp.]|nr:hypothetical protein [Flavisolibacter sp.]
MERIQALIDKLYQQKQQNSNPAQLLFTVQLLQSELLKLQQKNGTLGTAKVAVTLPVNMNFSEEVIKNAIVEEKEEPVVEKEESVVVEPVLSKIEIEQPVEQSSYQAKEYSLRRPVVTEEVVSEETVSRYAPQPQQVLNPAFSSVVETPTLAQYQPKREVNEAIAEKKESLNDRLKQDKTEVAHVLKETPIKDLRKGVGINDRFTFVRELFRGDDAFYERSIKTINSFHIFSEAEYWINRELKYKIGWDEDKEVVKHFYQLVRRRFS